MKFREQESVVVSQLPSHCERNVPQPGNRGEKPRHRSRTRPTPLGWVVILVLGAAAWAAPPWIHEFLLDSNFPGSLNLTFWNVDNGHWPFRIASWSLAFFSFLSFANLARVIGYPMIVDED